MTRFMLAAFIACLVPAACSLPGDAASGLANGEFGWRMVFEEEFNDSSSLENWRLEGFAETEIIWSGGMGYLVINTVKDSLEPDNKQSVFWYKEPFRGDLRFEFRARGEAGNRSILYFNARPVEGFGFTSIFGCYRPDARMMRYAGCDSIEMYSVGILRDDQDICNLRYIGGSTAPAYRNPEMIKDVQRLFGQETIFKAFHSPFLGKASVWYDFELSLVGRFITLKINGETVIEIEDPQDVGTNKFAWTALTNGGWFGFRNFVPGKVCYDYIRVYQRN